VEHHASGFFGAVRLERDGTLGLQRVVDPAAKPIPLSFVT
jgi:hypothetical protein